MIKYISHKDIDKQKWDDCIEKSSNRLIFAYSWYLDAVSPDWDALISDDYKIVMPLTWKKKYNIKYLYNPFFTQQLGVFTNKSISDELTKEFINTLQLKYKFIEINMNYGQQIKIPEFDGFKFKKNNNFILYLNSNYQTLYDNFSKSNKKNIRRAERQNFTLTNNINLKNFITFMERSLIKKIKETSSDDFKLLFRLLNTAEKYAEIKKYAVYSPDNKKLYAASFFIFFKDRITFHSASSEEGKINKVMFYLLNEFIKNHSQSNYILDFSGSNIPSIAYFFEGFGSTLQPYYSIFKYGLPWYFKIFKQFIDKIRTII